MASSHQGHPSSFDGRRSSFDGRHASLGGGGGGPPGTFGSVQEAADEAQREAEDLAVLAAQQHHGGGVHGEADAHRGSLPHAGAALPPRSTPSAHLLAPGGPHVPDSTARRLDFGGGPSSKAADSPSCEWPTCCHWSRPCGAVPLLLAGAAAFALGGVATWHGALAADSGSCCMPPACHAPVSDAAWAAVNESTVQVSSAGLCLFDAHVAAAMRCPNFTRLAADRCALSDSHGTCRSDDNVLIVRMAIGAAFAVAATLLILAIICWTSACIAGSCYDCCCSDSDDGSDADDDAAGHVRTTPLLDNHDFTALRPAEAPRVRGLVPTLVVLCAAALFAAVVDAILIYSVDEGSGMRETIAQKCLTKDVHGIKARGDGCGEMAYASLANCSAACGVGPSTQLKRLVWTLHPHWYLHYPLIAQVVLAAALAVAAPVAICCVVW